MKSTLRDRVRASLVATPGQTYLELINAVGASVSAVRTCVGGLQQSGELVTQFSDDPARKRGERLQLFMTDFGRARMREDAQPRVQAPTARSTGDTEGYGEEDAPNPYQGAAVPTFVRGTASFTCERRGAVVTHADCYDDHLDAEAYLRKSSPCFKCALGAEKRSAYAEA